jgi:hypothetical protein
VGGYTQTDDARVGAAQTANAAPNPTLVAAGALAVRKQSGLWPSTTHSSYNTQIKAAWPSASCCLHRYDTPPHCLYDPSTHCRRSLNMTSVPKANAVLLLQQTLQLLHPTLSALERAPMDSTTARVLKNNNAAHFGAGSAQKAQEVVPVLAAVGCPVHADSCCRSCCSA